MNIEPIIHFLFLVAACAFGCMFGDITTRWWRRRNTTATISRMITDAIDIPDKQGEIVSAEITFKIMRKGDPPSTEASTDGVQDRPS